MVVLFQNNLVDHHIVSNVGCVAEILALINLSTTCLRFLVSLLRNCVIQTRLAQSILNLHLFCSNLLRVDDVVHSVSRSFSSTT